MMVWYREGSLAAHLGWTPASSCGTLNDINVRSKGSMHKRSINSILVTTTDPNVSFMCISHFLRVYLELA